MLFLVHGFFKRYTMRMQDSFTSAYAALNSEQKKAVDTIEGPVMVIAGPGTGKTQILTLRIVHILAKTDTAPENILALTFTESGAHAMRERLRGYIGSAAYRVAIHTFHGFAESLIRQYPDAYSRIIGGRPATDVEKITLIQSIIDGGTIRVLRPQGDPAYYTKKVLGEIQTMKREYITPDIFSAIIANQEEELAGMPKFHEKGAHKGKVQGAYAKKEKSIEKNRELLHIYRAYEGVLETDKLYDFDDMILETLEALEKNEDMLRDLQETYHYLLADEHQDVNGSQNRILALLASYHESPNIFVVGDEKQAIFRFQGASLENFLYFEDVFKNTVTIALTDNYRSGQGILDAAHSLVEVEEGPLAELRVPLIARAVKQSRVERRDFTHQAVEDTWVTDTVASVLASGTEPEEVAVIVRTNKEVEQYAELLRKRGISVLPSADSDILYHPVTIAIRALIDAVVKMEDERSLYSVLHGAYFKIERGDLIRVLAARSFGEPLVTLISDEARLKELGVQKPEQLLRVHTVLTEARKKEVTEAPHQVLAYLLRESGFIDHALIEDVYESTRVIRRLYDDIEALVVREGASTLAEVSRVLDQRHAYNLPLLAPFITNDPHAVRVMTAHKSKGLEFAVVFIPHLVDSVWGGSTRRTYFDIPLTRHIDESKLDATDDERRLLYVAMTRAKHTLYFSSSSTNTEGRVFMPTRLFEDMLPELITLEPTETHEANFNPLATILMVPATSEIDTAFLKAVFLERGLSSTALNNYLKSPWQYLYRNLLRIPEVKTESLLFGTAVHSVLDRITGEHTRMDKAPTTTDIARYLEQALVRLPLTREVYTQLHEKGLKALTQYVAEMLPTLPKTTREEFSMRVVLATDDPDLPEIPLTGKLDRLDIDSEGKVIRIVDYKTGKPKTLGAVLGTTKGGGGEYKRQLVFYALLASLYQDERYDCRTCTLSFVEPDGKGQVVEMTFLITDEEIAELKAEIIRVAKEITSGTFIKTPCDPARCDYCHLVPDLLR